MLDDILKQIDYMAVLAPYNPRPRGNREIHVNCPQCGKPEAYIYRDGRSIICRRENACGQTTELLEIASGIRRARGEDFLKACEKLAALGGAKFERKRMSSEQRQKLEAMEIRADGLTLLRDIASENLKNQWDSFSGGPASEYLQSRNFDVVKSLEYGFGCITNVEALGKVMTPKQLEELGLYATGEDGIGYYSQKWNNRILIPMKDFRGKLMGFSGRTFVNDKTKYINTKGTSLKDLVAVGLDVALAHGSTAIGVEGFLDPFKARMNGIPGVIGIGTTGKALTAERWQSLFDCGVKHFVFITDNDMAGHTGLDSALANLDAAVRAPDVFTLSLPGDNAKDLDAWIDIVVADGGNPSQHFGLLYRARQHSDRFRAQQFAVGLDLQTEGDRAIYLHRTMDYDAGVKHPKRQLSLINHFWPEVQKLLGADTAFIRDICDRIRADRLMEQKRKAIDSVVSSSKSQLGQMHPDKVLADLKLQISSLEASHRLTLPSAALSPQAILSADVSALEEIAGKEFLGIPQRIFPTLDAGLSGLRGLVVIGGDTNIGKTILLAQMGLGAILNNDDTCCLFVSLEMPPQTIRRRLLSYLSGLPLMKLAGAVARGELQDTLHKFSKEVLPFMRFMSKYEPEGCVITPDAVVAEAENLRQITGRPKCLIIVDYMDVWEVDSDKFNTEMKEQKRQSAEMLYLRDNNPAGAVLAVKEIRKRSATGPVQELSNDDLSGAKRTGYGGDSVVLIQRFSDRMIYENFDYNDGFPRVRPYPVKCYKLGEEQQKSVDGMRKEFDHRGIFPLCAEITKIRDIGFKAKINLTMKWDINAAKEGLHL